MKNMNVWLKGWLLGVFVGLVALGVSAQMVPEHPSNRALYEFLDELATDHIIALRSVAKPYSRALIAEKLLEAAERRAELTSRQQEMLSLYLEGFALELDEADVLLAELSPLPAPRALLASERTTLTWLPPELRYRDELFRFSVKPIWGVRYYTNENGEVRHTHGGASAHGYVGDRWAVWASLRDNYQTNEVLSSPLYLNQFEGGAWKRNVQGRVGGDYSEMRTGVAYTWDWGSIAFMKDHLQWGDNYHGANILSGRTPSYPMLWLQLQPAEWLSFQYHHGWLVSMERDSVRSYTPYEGSPDQHFYHNKYIAANLITLTPLPRLDVSLGNSIIYSEQNVYPGYLIPFVFFKSVVHTQTYRRGSHNQNSAMFLNVSSRQIKHLHLYGTLFIDEFSKVRVGDPDRLNFNSTKAGFRLSNWPLPNVALTAEYTFTYPKTFEHRTPLTTFETNHYNLGHYMRANATDLYVALDVRPWRGLWLQLAYADARKGNLRPYLYGIEPRAQDTDPFMDETVWRNTTLALRARYTFYNNFSMFAEAWLMHVRGFEVDDRPAEYYLNLFSPDLFHGETTTFTFGLQMDF